MRYIPDFVVAFIPTEDLTMDILDALRSAAAIASQRASDYDCDATELKAATSKMNENISLLEASIEAVEQAFDTICRRQWIDPLGTRHPTSIEAVEQAFDTIRSSIEPTEVQ